jgi:hypothetical protein
MDFDTDQIINDFCRVANLAGVNLFPDHIITEHLPAQHRPPSSLPRGRMAIYAFFFRGQCLKVGKVAPKSQARYTSQHYNPNSSQSNLAKSILSHQDVLGLKSLNASSITDWIKQNTDRINFLFDREMGMSVLALMEAFLQCRLDPKFEGFQNQQ